jgi:hypothetical protein
MFFFFFLGVPLAFRFRGDKLAIDMCDTCWSVISNPKSVKPPKLAIANGNWIGTVPDDFKALRWLEEQTVALHLPYTYICKLWKDVGTNVMKSHTFLVKNPTPFVEMIPGDVAGKTRITLVGAFTKQEKVEIYNRYEWNLPLARKFAAFLRENNLTYSENIKPFDLPATSEVMIEDCSYDSAHPISEDTLKELQFSTTSHATTVEIMNERCVVKSGNVKNN